MNTVRRWRIPLLFIGILLVIVISANSTGLIDSHGDGVGSSSKLSLLKPTFLQSAQAAADFDIGEYLDQEAGISAWIDSGLPINLTNAATAFRVIETQTSEYIIGSVDLPNYSEHYDAHVYVHKDGWILAYYLRPDPASKIIAIRDKSITTTNLDSIIGIVAGAAGVPSTGVKYYDFRYPNAKNILLVFESWEDGNEFTIEMPGTNAYYERGWALLNSGGIAYFKLNGTDLPSTYANNSAYYGVISAAQLAPDVTHTIQVDNDGILMVIYWEP